MTQKWDFDNWDHGYVHEGRFRVYRPDCPNAEKNGYVLRYRAVWWLVTGKPCPKGKVLHHKNGNELDDRFENLEVMGLREHARHHLKGPETEFRCQHCGNKFRLSEWRVQIAKKRDSIPKFCSRECYFDHRYPARTVSA